MKAQISKQSSQQSSAGTYIKFTAQIIEISQEVNVYLMPKLYLSMPLYLRYQIQKYIHFGIMLNDQNYQPVQYQMNPISKKTEGLTSDYYQQLILQSSSIQHTLSTLSSLLSPLYLLQLTELTTKTFTIPQMEDVKIHICEMVSSFKENIYENVSIITEIMKSAGRVANQFQQLVDLMNSQNNKSSYTQLQLQTQLDLKNLQISQCEQAIKIGQQKNQCQEWKKNHYCKNRYATPNDENGITYLKVLRNIKYKLEMQLSQEQKEQFMLNHNINQKLNLFKTRLLNIWHTLPTLLQKQHSSVNQLNYFPKDRHSLNIECQISELQRLYVSKQKQIDEFSLSKLEEIKHKLKLLEKAEMQESRDLMYSGSINEIVEESEVKECGRCSIK